MLYLSSSIVAVSETDGEGSSSFGAKKLAATDDHDLGYHLENGLELLPLEELGISCF